MSKCRLSEYISEVINSKNFLSNSGCDSISLLKFFAIFNSITAAQRGDTHSSSVVTF